MTQQPTTDNHAIHKRHCLTHPVQWYASYDKHVKENTQTFIRTQQSKHSFRELIQHPSSAITYSKALAAQLRRQITVFQVLMKVYSESLANRASRVVILHGLVSPTTHWKGMMMCPLKSAKWQLQVHLKDAEQRFMWATKPEVGRQNSQR